MLHELWNGTQLEKTRDLYDKIEVYTMVFLSISVEEFLRKYQSNGNYENVS